MAGLASKTYNPSEEAPFKIEIASSGRSKCRNPACTGDKKTIKKGELRIARLEASPTEALNERLHGKLVPKWVHLRCCAPVILREAVDRYGGIEGVPGYDALEANKICEDPKEEAQALTHSILAGIEMSGSTGYNSGSEKKKGDDIQSKGSKKATSSKKKKTSKKVGVKSTAEKAAAKKEK